MDDQRWRIWGKALLDARQYLSRWNDAPTRCSREDMAQDTAFAVWRYAAAEPGARRLAALVRTISRRVRMKMLLQARRAGTWVADGRLEDWPAPEHDREVCLRVLGALVPRDWLVGRLAAALLGLSRLNRELVRAFYDGFSCRELSERFGISEDAVKVRLHRSRVVLRRRLEAEARAAGHFEP